MLNYMRVLSASKETASGGMIDMIEKDVLRCEKIIRNLLDE